MQPGTGSQAIVTGASSGIGADIARALAGRGMHVALVARRKAQLDGVARACESSGGGATVAACDLGDLDAGAALANRLVDELGAPTVLVNAAGTPRRIHTARLRFSDIEETMRVNYLGTMALTLGLLPAMLDAGRGDIVNIGSLAGRIPPPREGAYAASKHALAAMTETMRADLDGSGVKVHLVTPAVIDTPLWDVEGQEASPFRGTRVPESEVTGAVLDLIDSGRFEAYVPKRFRLTSILHALMGDRFIRSSLAYDKKRAAQAWPET